MDDAWENEDAEAAKAKPWQRLTQRLKTTIENRSRKDSDADSTVSDVNDFLNPGTSKPQIPKIDIVAARRASDSGLAQVGDQQQQQQQHDDQLKQLQINAKRKILRRAGLQVSFSPSEPVIIGEGGDEAADPPFEISRFHRQRLQHSRYQHSEAPTSQPREYNAQASRITRKAVPSELNFTSQLGPGPGNRIDLHSNASSSSPLPVTPPGRARGASNAEPFNSPSRPYQSQQQSVNEKHRSDYPPTKGLRKMQEDEGRTLITASQRFRFLDPANSPGHPPQSSSSSHSLQAAQDRLSFDSDLSGSQHSMNSVTAFPDQLADANDVQIDRVRDLRLSPEKPRLPQQRTTNPVLLVFADRIAHLKSVFRLSGEIHKPLVESPDHGWPRVALWWFLKSVINFENIVRNKSRNDRSRPMSAQTFSVLMQNYVNLAKTWYILVEVLEYNFESPIESPSGKSTEEAKNESFESTLAQHFEHLVVFLDREQLMPPGNLLIQGLDTTIWIEYPIIAPEDRAVLSGKLLSDVESIQNNLLLMPLGNSDRTHFYGRAFARTTVVSKVKRLSIPSFQCLVSFQRLKSDRHPSIVVASQIHLINIIVSGTRSGGLTWEQVRWMKETNGLRINVGQGLRLILEFSDPDYQLLCGLYNYSSKILSSLQPREDEALAMSMGFKKFLYEDSAHPGAFSAQQEAECTGFLFERFSFRYERLQEHRIHLGYRLAVSNSPQTRDLSSVSVAFEQQTPILYEYFTSPEPLIILHVNQRDRNRRLRITFQSDYDARLFLDHLTGQVLQPTESVTSPMPISFLSIDPIHPSAQYFASPLRMHDLQWQSVRVIRSRETSTALRLHLHSPGTTLIDYLPPQPLQIHLSTNSSQQNTLAILCPHSQESAILSQGPRATPLAQVAIAARLASLLFTAPATRRAYEFRNLEALHAFQAALTGWNVALDSSADMIKINQSAAEDAEEMYGPARIQLIQRVATGRVQLVAFFNDRHEQRHDQAQEDDLESGQADTQILGTSLRIGLPHTLIIDQLDDKPDITERPGRLGKLRLEKWRRKDKDRSRDRAESTTSDAASNNNNPAAGPGFTAILNDAKVLPRGARESPGFTSLDAPRPRSWAAPPPSSDQQKEQARDWDDRLPSCAVAVTFPSEHALNTFTTALSTTLACTVSSPRPSLASQSSASRPSTMATTTATTITTTTTAAAAAGAPEPDSDTPSADLPASEGARGAARIKGFVKRFAAA